MTTQATALDGPPPSVWFRVAMLGTLFGSQILASAFIAVATAVVRPPPGGIPTWGWALLACTVVLALPAVVVSAMRVARHGCRGAFALVGGGIGMAVIFVVVRHVLLLRP